MPKIRLTENWRWYKQREIINVTPGQFTSLITLQKGVEYKEPEPVIEKVVDIVKDAVQLGITTEEVDAAVKILEKPKGQPKDSIVKKVKRTYKPRKSKKVKSDA